MITIDSLMVCLHDPANVQQIFSNRNAGRLLDVCWKFAKSLLDVCWIKEVASALSDGTIADSLRLTV